MNDKPAQHSKRQSKRKTERNALALEVASNAENLGFIRHGVEELTEDNVHILDAITRLHKEQGLTRSTFLQEIGKLRDAISDELALLTLRNICMELTPLLNVLERMLQSADLQDADKTRDHLFSFSQAFERALQRTGIDRLPVVAGKDLFNPHFHDCVKVCKPEESPFPEAPPKTIVFIEENGYTLRGRLALPARVWVQESAVEPVNDKEGEEA